jgi:hypothetical protein
MGLFKISSITILSVFALIISYSIILIQTSGHSYAVMRKTQVDRILIILSFEF